MPYTPPPGDEADFDLQPYTPPAGDEADFEFSEGTPIDVTDTGTGVDTIEVVFGISVSDTGSGSDAVAVQVTAVSLTDTGSGSDTVAVQVFVNVTDTGTGVDAVSYIPFVNIFDTGVGVDEINIIRKAGANYRIIVRDENDVPIGEFDKFRALKFGKRLNNYGTASFEIPTDDEKTASLVALRKYTVWIYREAIDEVLVWSGEQALRQGKLDNKGDNWCTIYCYDWLEQLNARYTAAEEIFTNVDAGEIAWTLIDDTQSQTNGDFGITEGTIEPTVNRDRTYYNDNIMQMIINLSNVISGFDFEITNLRVFNVREVIGTDKTDTIRFEYGYNIESVEVIEDFVQPVNRAIIIGQSTDDLVNLIRVERDDAASQAEFKVREFLSAEMDVSETDTMEEKGDAFLRKFGLPLLKVDMNLASVYEPNITQFGLGDAITLIIQSGIYDIEGQYRVFEWEVEFDTNNAEHLSLVLGNFTYE